MNIDIKNIKVEVNDSLPENAIMLIACPPKGMIFHGYKEVLDYYFEHLEKIVIATNLEKENKKEKLRILLEGRGGFFREYQNAIEFGSIGSLSRVINETTSKIFDLFEEELDGYEK